MVRRWAHLSNSFQTMSLEKNLESLRKRVEKLTRARNDRAATLQHAGQKSTYHKSLDASESSASADILLRLRWQWKACCRAAARRCRRDKSCSVGQAWQTPSWLRGHGGAQKAGVSVATCMAATNCRDVSIRVVL